MGIHRLIRRYRNLGTRATADYVRRRLSNKVIRLANRVGPTRHGCPCCGWKGARFFEFAGHGYGTGNIVCPDCGSHPRHRALFLYLSREVAKLQPGGAVLHLAPEKALVPIFTARKDLVYVTMDLTLRSAAVRADITSMPLRDDSVEMVICSHVLEHLVSDRAAIAEIARVLALKGRTLILVPTLPNWKTRATEEFGAPQPQFDDHFRIYGCDLIERIEEAGLRCRTVGFYEFITPEERERYRLFDEPLFIAEKVAALTP